MYIIYVSNMYIILINTLKYSDEKNVIQIKKHVVIKFPFTKKALHCKNLWTSDICENELVKRLLSIKTSQ